MSSTDVVKSVSRKLKYYFQVKRLEDGFDLSSADCPKLDHPPLRSRPTLMYDGLHDRPLKHYYSPTEVRAVLTQFKTKKSGEEGQLKKQINRYMKQYSFVYRPESAISSTSSPRTRQHTTLGDPYYVHDKKGRRKLRPDIAGYGVILPKRKLPHKGSYPVLRTVPNSYATRGEAKRLLNNASKILVATRTIDLQDKEDKPSKKQRPKSGAPRSFETREAFPPVEDKKDRPKSSKGRRDSSDDRGHNIYTYDPQGNKIYLRTEGTGLSGASDASDAEEEDNDSTYGTHTSSPSPGHGGGGNGYVTIDGEPADDGKVPPWLKKEMKKKDKDDEEEWVRPHSAPHPPKKKGNSHRASSAASRRGRKQENKNGNNSKKHQHNHQHKSPPAKRKNSRGSSPKKSGCGKAAWGTEDKDNIDVTSPHSDDASVQTGGELLRDYDPMDKTIWDGEKCRYKLHVFTGTRLGSSTKAPVKVALCGDRGRTEDVWLRNSTNHKVMFQKGQEDIFVVDTFFVGPVRKIQMGHDSNEAAHSWFVTRIIVKDVDHQQKYDIPCEKWFCATHDDGKTIRVLNVDTGSAFIDATGSDEDLAPQEPPPETIFISAAEPIEEQEQVEPALTVASKSNTSMKTLTSGRRSSSGSTSSSNSGSTYSSSSSSASSSSTATPTRKPSPPPPRAAAPKRRDDFFDQQIQEKDYSSVIESLSHASDPDHKDDFPEKKEVEDTKRYRPDSPIRLREDVVATEEEEEEEDDTARFAINDVESEGGRSSSRLGNVNNDDEARLHAPMEEDQTPDPMAELLRGPSVHQCAKTGDLDTLKKWIQHNPDFKTKKNDAGECPLHNAASHGQMETVQWLSIHVNDLDEETATGYTAIHQAAMGGHTNVMMVLSAMGAKISSKTIDDQTPLHLAAMSGHFECVKWLVANRASITATDNNNRTPYDLAVTYDQTEVAQFLDEAMQEQQNPQSLMHRMRFKSQRTDIVQRSGPSESKEEEDSDKESWKNDSRPSSGRVEPPRPRSSRGSSRNGSASSNRRPDSASSASSLASNSSVKSKPKHDEELLEKRKLYEEQQKKMETKQTSFLDSIRNEVNEDEENEEKTNENLRRAGLL